MNTAGRLLSIYDKLVTHGKPTHSMRDNWALAVFDLPENSQSREDEVVPCLHALRGEIALFRNKLLAADATEDMFHLCFIRFQDVASTAHLNSTWDSHRQNMSLPDIRLPLLWANWAFRDETEEDMPAEELTALSEELNSLERSLQETEMTPYLRDFIQRQVNAIRSALRVYKVQGVKPIKEALHKAAGAYTLEKAQVDVEFAAAPEPAKGLFARTAAFVKKTAEVADNLDKIGRAGEGAVKLAVQVGPIVLPYAQLLIEMAKNLSK